MDSPLYERLGGRDSIAAVVADFCARSVADDRIKAKYARTNAARLEAMLVDQLCEATGGPVTYRGRLNHFEVPRAEQDELLGLLAPMRDDIVEVQSPQTGTPLPKGFQPAA